VNDIPEGEILCYGQKDVSLQPVSLDELINLFEHNKNFINPLSRNEVFSRTSITKLKRIAENVESLIHIKDSTTLDKWKRLLELIDLIDMLSNNQNASINDFIKMYDEGTEEDKMVIRKILYSLFHLSMYMRGWFGESHPYPIKEATVSDRDIFKQFTLVEKELEIFKEYEKDERGRAIHSLPLIRYIGGEFLKSTDPDVGITIIDRINIVESGENTDNMESCIRTSSNWFAATSYFYMKAIKIYPPFRIDDLRVIQ
jgi:hypothetical protein